MNFSGHTAVILSNLGTPEAPTVPAVKAYLKTFLMDPFVIDIPFVWRHLLVKGLIVPFRAHNSTHAYQSIWTPQGSPLAVYHEALAQAVQKKLEEKDPEGFIVLPVFRYGKKGLENALQALKSCSRLSKIIFFPLYPQYAYASSESTLMQACSLFRQQQSCFKTLGIVPFYHHEGFIQAIADQIQKKDNPWEHLLFSFHGIPERHIRKTVLPHARCLMKGCCEKICFSNHHCYRAQCYQTAHAVAQRLSLDPKKYSVSFQSRLGRTPWIKPYTDFHLKDLLKAGVKNIAVCCPSFVADCLETLEEIGIRAKQDWETGGGDQLTLIPCVNTHPVWVNAVVEMIQNEKSQFTMG